MGNLILNDIGHFQEQIANAVANAVAIPKSYLGWAEDTIISESEDDFENKRIEYYGA